jgi:flagellar P-ring protein precursor FlgI
MKHHFRIFGLILVAIMLVTCIYQVRAEKTLTLRLKDLARIEGVRDNQLTGLGLVVGLNGTGDSNKTVANIQMIVNILDRHGIQVDPKDLKVKNIAAVMITAMLPSYLRNGDRLDVQVSSFGDAKSLQGGILLQTPLTAADGRVYAVAQGPVVVSGYSAAGGGNQKVKNVPTAGSIPNGALIEREVTVTTLVNGRLRLILNHPDFTTASRLATTINENIGQGLAKAMDMSLVEVNVPLEYATYRLVDFIAKLEALYVAPDGRAKVVINERTGIVVVGEGVRIAPIAVTHGSLTVEVKSTPEVSQPPPLSGGDTMLVQQENVSVEEKQGLLVELEASATVGEVVRALNAVGSTPQEIITILVAIHQAGALYGMLEVV